MDARDKKPKADLGGDSSWSPEAELNVFRSIHQVVFFLEMEKCSLSSQFDISRCSFPSQQFFA